MAQRPGTPPGSQYGITAADWLQTLGAGLGGLYRGPGQGTAVTLALLQRLQKQQEQANKAVGYAPKKPAQAFMDWVKKWLTEQEDTKMGALMPSTEETEAP